MHRSQRFILQAIPALLLLSGCSDTALPTHAVSGRVTYQGKPAAGVQVGFHLADEINDAKPARGQCDKDGRYTLSTYLSPHNEASGAVAGNYVVTVQQGLSEKQIVNYDDLRNQRNDIPTHYADANTSPLSVIVTSSGDNQFDFTLQAERYSTRREPR